MKKGIIFFVLMLFMVVILVGCGKEVDNTQTNNTKISTNTNSTNTSEIEVSEEFIQCLADNGMTIYGSAWCPACKDLRDKLGGEDMIGPIYIECTEEEERCNEEMKDNYVPEIQIFGELYSGQRDPASLAEATGCTL